MSAYPTPQEYAELLRRALEQGREDLFDELEVMAPYVEFGPLWLQPTAPDSWVWDWAHQKLIYRALNRVARGECKRLMIFMPPRHMKSETCTVRFSGWWLERDPTQRVILGAYSQEFANLFSRKVRRITGPRLPLAPDSRAVQDWETQAGGGFKAAGVGAGVTGRGANLILIDDPVKNREEADSEAYRERCWEWYTNDLWSRQEPGCAIILIMTRWHGDDLAGRLLQQMKAGGERWEVLNLPALAETQSERDQWAAKYGLPSGQPDPLGRDPGQALCPERYDVAFFEAAKKQDPRGFWSLYQQSPRAAEGNLFKGAWFRKYWIEGDYYVLDRGDRLSRYAIAECLRFSTSDWAASEKTAADRTVVGTWVETPSKDLLLLDVKKDRLEGPKAKSLVRFTFQELRPQFILAEKNGLGGPLVRDLIDEGYPIRGVHQHRDKVSRAQAPASRYEAGKIFHPVSADWLDEFEDELTSFPHATHDDQVDMLSLAASVIAPGAVVGIFADDFSVAHHVSREELEFDPARPFVCGWSFDPLPAWVLGQLDGDGVFGVLAAEVGVQGEGVYAFGTRVLDLLGRYGLREGALHHFARPAYCGSGSGTLHPDAHRILAHGVEHVTGYDERTSDPLSGTRPGLGILLLPSEERREMRDELLKGRLSLLVKGRPALVVDPTCSGVIEALSGGYCWKVNAAGLLQNDVEPNVHSAVVEALGCALAGLFAAVPVDPHEDEWRIPARGTAGGVGRRREAG